MRIGVLCRGEVGELNWARRLGFRSVAWMRFAESACGPAQSDWKPHAEELAGAARDRDIRISAIGAFYANPLDPRQTERARSILHRAIEVAAHLGVRTVSAFAGAVIETTLNERGGNPVYRPFEECIPQLLGFWEPVAGFASDHGVRVALENCPQATFNLPIMGYNAFARPAIWERFFDATRHANIGIEWDPSHLICQFIDPVQNLRRFGARVFHVHAKDAWVDRSLMERYGICHAGVTEHRLPGFGQADWAQIVHALVRAGYDSDLNIEGRHDPVFRDHPESSEVGRSGTSPLAGRKLEETGLVTARDFLTAITGVEPPA
jgi:sugar phosphate isomerase/epimerase